jgi:hypothetical protein
MTTRNANATANAKAKCRSFDCVFDDETVKHFAQDDKLFLRAWMASVLRAEVEI